MDIRYLTRGFELTSELEKYANRKIARLAKKVPRRARTNAVCDVTFGQTLRRGSKLSTCSISLAMGEKRVRAKETTQHMYAALDIAAVDVEQQLKERAQARRHGILRRRRSTEE